MNALGLEHRITDHLSDGRHGTNTQFRAADLLRQSVYSRLAGYEDLNAAVGEFSEERWRRQYNTVRPHSALGYRPPAPAAISPAPLSGMIMSPALS